MINETQKKIINFINSNERRQVILTDRNDWQHMLIKANTGGSFDFIYSIDYINKGAPSFNTKGDFCGMIDTRTQELYFAEYEILKYFDDWRKGGDIQQLFPYTTIESVNKQYNDDISKEFERMAKSIPDDSTPTDDDLYRIESDTAHDFFYETLNPRKTTVGMENVRDLRELAKYLENPAAAVAETIKEQEKRADKWNAQYTSPTAAIKYNKMMQRLQDAELERIKTSNDEKYQLLRLAKKIKDSKPENAKSVKIYYQLSNGETLTATMEAKALDWMPDIKRGREKCAYYASNIDKPSRDKLEAIDGRWAEIQLVNILKITYQGKETYTKAGA